MKKIIFLFLFTLSVWSIHAQDFSKNINNIYSDGYPDTVTSINGTFLNVKVCDDRIWVTIDYRNGNQRATEIVRDDFGWKVSSRKRDDNIMIAGCSLAGENLFSIGFPDRRSIYKGDKKLIKSTYPQRDIIEFEKDNYLVTIERDGVYQIYNYQKGITKYPELVFEDMGEYDLLNLSYYDYDSVLVFDRYSSNDGDYITYCSHLNRFGRWEAPEFLKLPFSAKSVCFTDSILVGIQDNQLFIWELIPDSWWTWEPLSTAEYDKQAKADTNTSEVVFFLWEAGDKKGNLIIKTMFDSLGFSISEELIIDQSKEEVADAIGKYYDMYVNSSGFLFSENIFDLVTTTNNDNSGPFDFGTASSTEDSLRQLVASATDTYLQVGAYGETTYLKHHAAGGFQKMIGGSYIIHVVEKTIKGTHLFLYRIFLQGYTYERIDETFEEYKWRLAKIGNDTPFLILIIDGKYHYIYDGLSIKYEQN